jgi:D-glycero-D-manno-heptose 1,7-bisphosphate phosphatase
MVKLCDLDGTLITSYMDTPDKAYARWYVLPGRVARLATQLAAGHQLGILTNQGGVAFGRVSERQAVTTIAAALVAMPLPAETPVAVCYADPRSTIARSADRAQAARRTPSGAMIRELVAADPAAAATGLLLVGDRPEDAAAAAAAGVAFAWAADCLAGAA